MLLTLVLAVTWIGCDLIGTGGDSKKTLSLPDGSVLAASVDGNEPGLWLFNPATLERTTRVEAFSGYPPNLTFSSDYRRWYGTWREGSQLDGTLRSVLVAFDPQNGTIVKRRTTSDLAVGGSYLTYDSTRDEIVAYGGSVGAPVHFFDDETLELAREHSLGGEKSYVATAAVAEERGRIYFGANTEESAQIYAYDTANQAIMKTFLLTEDPTLQRSALSDVALSPDERYLFATTFLSPGGPGRFYMVDLKAGETIFEGPAGGYSNLAIHPDGRYVYIDCPAGGLRNLIPTQKVLRFDVEARKMEIFIDGPEELGLKSGALIADQITMLPGGETLVMTIAGGVENAEGRNVHLTRVDAGTGQALATYSLPHDDRGYITSRIRFLKYGIVSR